MSSTQKAIFFIILCLTENIWGLETRSQQKNFEKESNFWDSLKKTIYSASENEYLITAAVSGAIIYAAPVVAGVAGFGAGGIKAGSLASLIHTYWFKDDVSGITGKVFSWCQRIGAKGFNNAEKLLTVPAVHVTLKARHTPKADGECK